MPPQSESKYGLRWSGEINIVSILQVLILSLVAAFFYTTNAANKGDNTAADVTSVKQTMTIMKEELFKKIGDNQTDTLKKIADTQQDTKDHFEELRRQVAGLPDQRADIQTLKDRTQRLEANKETRDKQFTDLHDQVVQDHAAIQGIIDANRQPLGMKR